MRKMLRKILLSGILVGMTLQAYPQHPGLLLSQEGVMKIRTGLGSAPLFDRELEKAIQSVDQAISSGIVVPFPKDMAGGYSHEVHKRNWLIMQQAGVLYQVTEEEKYAVYVRDMLLEYAELYPALGPHPTNKSYAPGKLFWQCLNDANWLVYVSQAYDCIYEFLTEQQRQHLEDDLFRPYADYLSIKNPQFFDRIHNHSTWGCAAVGMIGLVMEDEELVSRALYGLGDPSDLQGAFDNDGGLLVKPGQFELGFLAQMDGSFSPDGYFTEGPYYLRYAIFPFLLFSTALDNKRPEMDILVYRDSILKKSVYSLINQTDANGLIFPINDAQKGMSWEARGVVTGVDLVYHLYDQDPLLLSVARKQGWVTLDEAGFHVAQDLVGTEVLDLNRSSVMYRDGENGDQGGVAILRSTAESGRELSLVFKYSAQGGGHGHYDKLSYSLYGESGEIIQDYGAVRWVNIDQKGGGRYLPENKTWGKQTIAHNTLTVDESTQYDENIRQAESHAPHLFGADISDPTCQWVSAVDSNAYEEVILHRTMVLLADSGLSEPLLVDIFRVQSEEEHQYDLPTWYQGHLLESSIDITPSSNSLSIMGESDGYQHMWLEGQGIATEESISLTWFSDGEFTTMKSVTDAGDLLLSSLLGANDPLHNLRKDAAFVIRKNASDELFVSVLEHHGQYNPADEVPHQPFSRLDDVEVLLDTRDFTVIRFSLTDGSERMISLSNQNSDTSTQHHITLDQNTTTWKGPFHYQVNHP